MADADTTPALISPKMQKRLDNDFTYHPPFGDQVERYTQIRNEGKNFAELCAASCPESRELSVALTKIEEAVMWANSAIARNEKEF